ncbi:MAG: HlyD family efflux transporter periplasmic adaptor subunit [Saprospiraceae bacterium]
MLNISENSILNRVDTNKYHSFQQTDLPKVNRPFKRWLLGLLLLFVILLFLPWTQNIQTKGKVTTLRPDQRPQTIHSTIAGRVEKWYVREGQLVKKGDTIVHLSEIKTEYFDPNLINRAGQQVEATEGGIASYQSKVGALENQIAAMRQELFFKKEQLVNKVQQYRLKIQSDSIELTRAVIDLETAQKQYLRTKELYGQGLKSLTDVEDKNLKVQETAAKKVAIENKLLTSRNELENARLDLINVQNEYANKIAKAESDKFTALSSRFDAEGKLQKLQVDLENYRQRSGFYFITAPQDCYITQAIVTGLGETIKEGAPLVSIMPANAELAVEMFVKPIDLPLINLGNTVNFIFDGWPAFVFSGWPNLTFGTFEGKVVAIDNNIGPSGTFRILVAPIEEEKAWPKALRPGGGAQAVALLNDVPLWYELWRQLNGFPPDFYETDKVGIELKKEKK